MQAERDPIQSYKQHLGNKQLMFSIENREAGDAQKSEGSDLAHHFLSSDENMFSPHADSQVALWISQDGRRLHLRDEENEVSCITTNGELAYERGKKIIQLEGMPENDVGLSSSEPIPVEREMPRPSELLRLDKAEPAAEGTKIEIEFGPITKGRSKFKMTLEYGVKQDGSGPGGEIEEVPLK